MGPARLRAQSYPPSPETTPPVDDQCLHARFAGDILHSNYTKGFSCSGDTVGQAWGTEEQSRWHLDL